MPDVPYMSMTYAGPIAWYAMALQSGAFVLEAHENFQKQSYRNRCYILSHQGIQMLNIPVERKGPDVISEIRISFRENWPQVHWRALEAGYGSTPFFEILAPEIEPIYKDPPATLWEFNLSLMETFLEWLDEDVTWKTSDEYFPKTALDHRSTIHPRNLPEIQYPTYYQVFENEVGFQPGLSIFDAFFHLGPATAQYLHNIDLTPLKVNP